jgi:hypothetical protein
MASGIYGREKPPLPGQGRATSMNPTHVGVVNDDDDFATYVRDSVTKS